MKDKQDEFKPSTLRKTRQQKSTGKVKMPYRLKIRFTEEQKAKIEADAKSVGLKKTAFARARILSFRILNKSEEEKHFRRVLTNACTNINTIARQLPALWEAVAAMSDKERHEKAEDIKNEFCIAKENILEMLSWFQRMKAAFNKDAEVNSIPITPINIDNNG